MATVQEKLEKAFRLDGDIWLRHANPWSVYTRIPIPAALTAAVWSRTRLGRWSLVPVAAVCGWTWVNVRAFPAPQSLDHWASKAVLGERMWNAAENAPLAARHRSAVAILTGVNALGLPLIIWGTWARKGGVLVAGLAVQTLGKLWTLDRMVWFYEDVTHARAEHAGGPASVALATDAAM
jgi:hypothetical protein